MVFDSDAMAFFDAEEGAGRPLTSDQKAKFNDHLFVRLKEEDQWPALTFLKVDFGRATLAGALTPIKNALAWPAPAMVDGSAVYTQTGAGKGIEIEHPAYLDEKVPILDLVPAEFPILTMGVRATGITGGHHTLMGSYTPTGDTDRFYIFCNSGNASWGFGSASGNYAGAAADGEFAIKLSNNLATPWRDGVAGTPVAWNNQGFQSGTIHRGGVIIAGSAPTLFDGFYIGGDLDIAVMHEILTDFEAQF